MADLISRAAAMKAFMGKPPEYYHTSYIVGEINCLPTIDAAPVVHGRWIDIPDKPEWDQKMCSVCGDYFCCQNNYCPNCGAKMETRNE